MSKDPRPAQDSDPAAWDPRVAYHQAVLVVFEKLGELMALLHSEPDRKVAGLYLDDVLAKPLAHEPGDADLTAQLKQAVGHLRSSLGTVEKIQRTHNDVGSAFSPGRGVYPTWAGVGSVSYHEVVVGAADALLEHPRRSDVIRKQVLEAGSDQQAWKRLADDLKEEFRLASLLPPITHQAAEDPTAASMERLRREHKSQQVTAACESGNVDKMCSLWQDTTDLLFRTNLSDDSRVEELWHLRAIAFAFTVAARESHRDSEALQKLSGLLRTLMPREWFPNESVRETVRSAVAAANVEVEEVYLASLNGVRVSRDAASERPGDSAASKEPADSDDDYRDPAEWAGEQVKIPVQQADGTYKGSLFKDGPWHKHRWTGVPKPNLQESMVCMGDLDSGEWFLIEYVLPRRITGRRECDSLFDTASFCCRRTPAQALHWFMQQAFGPPPALLERVRRFARDWKVFCASTSAQTLLKEFMERRSVGDDDPLFAGAARDDLNLLCRVELAHAAESPVHYHANGVARDMGVDGYITWMQGHLDRVSTLLVTGDDSASAQPADRFAAAQAADGDSPQTAVSGQSDVSILPPSQETSASGARSPTGEWRPSAHQELVLSVLRRDGRLRTGVLWERISPKHLNLRAHQNAMSDLVEHGRVLTAGKAQATEYWLP